MARIRTLKPSFWEDPDISCLSRDARLTAIAIISYADDRGRLELNATAIRGYAFRRDKVTDRRVRAWMLEVVQSGMARTYNVAGVEYLWLPKFWSHQVINKPSESQLPPPPDDPYGGLPIDAALAQFREDSRSPTVVTPVVLPSPPRARAGAAAQAAGSLPFPAVDQGLTSNDNGDSNPAPARRGRVDQTAYPDGFPAELIDKAEAVLRVLDGIWRLRGGVQPQRRGVGLALRRNPLADHLAVARKLEYWLTAGKGAGKRCGDVTQRFGDWLEDEPAAAARRPAAPNVTPLRDYSAYDQAAGL